jgi:hypothetical protein
VTRLLAIGHCGSRAVIRRSLARCLCPLAKVCVCILGSVLMGNTVTFVGYFQDWERAEHFDENIGERVFCAQNEAGLFMERFQTQKELSNTIQARVDSCWATIGR